MTERDICNRIIEDGDCSAIDCHAGIFDGLNKDGPNCPLGCAGGCDDAVENALRWLADHSEEIVGKTLQGKIGHSCTYQLPMLRFLQKEDGSRILQSSSRCVTCGKMHWTDVPMVKESEVVE